MPRRRHHEITPHGHLNLIGFVAMSVFGAYYALPPPAAQSRLAVVHFGLVVLTVVILTPGIVLAISGQGEVPAQMGSILAVISMALFGFVVLRYGVGMQPINDPDGQAVRSQPAE